MSSSDVRLNLKIVANTDGNARALGQTSKGIDRIGKSAHSAKSNLLDMNRASKSLTNTLFSLAGVYSLKSLGETILSDTAQVQDLTTRLHTLTKEAGDYADVIGYISTVATEQHKKITDLADGYAKLRNLQNSGLITYQRTQDFFEGLSNAASALGASNEQLKQTYFGLSQSLSVLNAENFNQVMEPLPGLLQEMDKAAGLAAGGFRQLVISGDASVELFSDTLAKALRSYDGAAAATAQNINAKTTDISNSWTRMIMNMERPISLNINPALDAINSIIAAIAEFDGNTIVESIVTIGKISAAVFAGVIASSLASYISTKAAAIQMERAHALAIKENLAIDVARANSLVATAQAKVADLTATNNSIIAARADATASLQATNASIASAKATISATNATIQSTGTKWINKQATDALSLAEAKRSVLMAEMAVLGKQQASTHALIAKAEIAQATATKGLTAAEAKAIPVTTSFATSLKLLLSPLNLINLGLAAFAGWELGKLAREFESVRVAAAKSIGFIMEMIERVSSGAKQFFHFINGEDFLLDVEIKHHAEALAQIKELTDATVDFEKNKDKVLDAIKKQNKAAEELEEKNKKAKEEAKKAATDLANAINDEIDALIDENLKLTLSERAFEARRLRLVGMNAAQVESNLAIWDASRAIEAEKLATEEANKATEKRINWYLDLKEASNAHFKQITDGLNDEIASLTLSERAYFAYANQISELEPDQQDFILRLYDTTRALAEQETAILSLSDELNYAFDSMIFDGATFTDAMVDMVENMTQRMISSLAEFANDNLVRGLFNGSFGQTLLGVGAGALAIGASYLFNGTGSPNRSDIAPSRTTTSGDDRALGFAEMVAADISSRDYYYAQQLAVFKDMQQDMKLQVQALTTAVAPFRESIKASVIGFGDSLFASLPGELKNSLSTIGDVLEPVFDISASLDTLVDKLLLSFSSVDGAIVSNITDELTGFLSGSNIGSDIASGISDSVLNAITPSTFDSVGTATANGLGDAINGAIPDTFQGLQADIDAGSASSNAGALLSVLTAAYGVYGLISNWDELSTENKVLSTISTISSVVSAAASASVSLVGAAATAAATGVSNAALAAIPVAGWIVAAVINVVQTALKFAEGDLRGGTDQLLTGGLGGMLEGYMGINTHHFQLDGITLGGDFAMRELFGISLSDILGKQRVPNAWTNTLRKANDPGFYDDPSFHYGDRVAGADPRLSAWTGNKDVRVGVNTPFGQTRFSTHEVGNSKQQGIDLFGDVLLAIYEIDKTMADAINKSDGALAGMGETLQFYDNWLRAGNRIAFKQDLDDFDMASFIEKRYAKINDVLAQSGTKTGVAFNTYFDILADGFGEENTLSALQATATFLEPLMKMPVELAHLMSDSIKAFDLGGTPNDAMKEMVDVISGFVGLSFQFQTLGETDFSEEQIIGFLAHVNEIGFGVGKAAESLSQYARVLHLMDVDISEGILRLVERSKDMSKVNFSNFIQSAGATASLGNTLGLSFNEDDIAGVAQLVGQIAKDTLDQAEYDSLKDQAVKYGGLTVTEARQQIEDLGLATGDAILQIVNEVMFLDSALTIFKTSLSGNVEDVVLFSHELVEEFGDIDKASEAFGKFSKYFFTEVEQYEALVANLQKNVDSLSADLGVSGVTEGNFLEIMNANLNSANITPETTKKWIEFGNAIGFLTENQDALAAVIEKEARPNLEKEIQLLEAQGRGLEALALKREQELATLEPAARAIQLQINAAIDLASQRVLELELMEAQGKTQEVLAIKRQDELDALNPLLRSIQAQINAENDLAAVRERAAARAATIAGLDVQLLKAQGNDQAALKIEREAVLAGYAEQMQADIDALIQWQSSVKASLQESLNKTFTESDAKPIDAAFSSAVLEHISANAITTVSGVYEEAMKFGLDIFDVGQAFGLNAAQTAAELTKAGIAGFAVPDTSDIDQAAIFGIKQSYAGIVEAQQQIWDLEDAANGTVEATSDLVNIEQAITDQRKSLQEQINELALSYTEKINMQRAALYDVNRALFDNLQGLKLAAQQRDLDIQLLDAQGKSQEALASRRSDELVAMDGSLHATQRAIWAAQDLTKSNNDLIQSEQNLIDFAKSAVDVTFKTLQKSVDTQRKGLTESYNNSIASTQKAIDRLSDSVSHLSRISSTLKSSFDSLTIEGNDSGTRQQAQAFIKDALITARTGGELPDNDALSKALGDVSKPSAHLFATFTDYQRDFFRTATDIKELSSYAQTSLDYETAHLDALKNQLEVSKAGYQSEIDRLDGVLKSAQSQIDAVNGSTLAVLSVGDAVASLAGAVDAQAAAQAQATALAARNAAEATATQAALEAALQAERARSDAYRIDETGSFTQPVAGPSVEKSAMAMAAEVLYKSVHGGVPTLEYNAAAEAVGGNIAGALGWDGSLAMLEQFKAQYSFSQGINEVPFDMVANIHEGERVLPKADNRELMHRLSEPVRTNESEKDQLIKELIGEIKQLRSEVREGQAAIATGTNKTAKILRAVTKNGTSISTTSTA